MTSVANRRSLSEAVKIDQGMLRYVLVRAQGLVEQATELLLRDLRERNLA